MAPDGLVDLEILIKFLAWLISTWGYHSMLHVGITYVIYYYMANIVDRICAVCSAPYQVERRYIKYEAKINNKSEGEVRLTCSNECAIKLKYKGKRDDFNCKHCFKQFTRLKSHTTKSSLLFCSQSCSASYYNNQRKLNGYTTKNKTIYRYCNNCKEDNKPFLLHAGKNCACLICTPFIIKKKSQNKNPIKQLICQNKDCNATCIGKTRKYCPSCVKEIQSKNGRSNAAKRQKRSKSEIYLEELCKKDNLNIKCNSQLFNGWDCDIALMDYKIAILWNGPWHYQECGGKHSLAQTQSRDKIKLKEIIKSGWQPYIIEDRKGKFKESFVQDNFNNIKLFIETIKN